MGYEKVFVGGTFDGLHAGHQSLILEAFRQGDQVIISLTSDRFVSRFKSQIPNPKSQISYKSQIPKEIKPFEKRKSDLEEWLGQKGLLERARIILIDDPYEPAASMELDAIIVTAQTKARALEINTLRSQRNLPELVIIEVPLVLSYDTEPISSSRMRTGEIDYKGNLIMPEYLREFLGKPLGTYRDSEKLPQSLMDHQGRTIITVGDITTERVISLGVIPSLAIIDLHVNRRPYDTLSHIPETLLLYSMEVTSGPGFITGSAMKAIAAWALHLHPTLMIVTGEEDLLTLPAILEGPLGSVVYYGQPNRGIVSVDVTAEKKEHVAKILERFQREV